VTQEKVQGGFPSSFVTRAALELSGLKGLRIGVAVSGGGDSMALLNLLHEWGGGEVDLAAVTVNHGLRAEAASEAEFVASVCENMEIPHQVLYWDGTQNNGNLQNAARVARYRLLADWALEMSRDIVLLAHTSNDVAETFLMNLSRSAGIDGLAAMPDRFVRNGVTFARPLLRESRLTLRSYLKACGRGWIEDPSNHDLRFDRVKMRGLLDILEGYGLSAEVVSDSAFALADSRDIVRNETSGLARSCAADDRGDVLLSRIPFASAPFELRRRLLALAIRYVSNAEYPPRHASVATLLNVKEDNWKSTLGGCVITADQKTLRIAREFSSVRGTVCASDKLWDNRWKFTGPHRDGLEIRVLGEDGIKNCPDWRSEGLPWVSILSSPAIWDGETMISAPVAGFSAGWSAQIVADFITFVEAH